MRMRSTKLDPARGAMARADHDTAACAACLDLREGREPSFPVLARYPLSHPRMNAVVDEVGREKGDDRSQRLTGGRIDLGQFCSLLLAAQVNAWIGPSGSLPC